jgi:hypothetical protein
VPAWNLDFQFSVDERSCIFRGSLTQTGVAVGGAGRFAGVSGSYTGGVTACGILARRADGSCSDEQAPIIELDAVTATGTLNF